MEVDVPNNPYGLCGRKNNNIELNCHHQNYFCIKMGSDESHLNVSSMVRDKVDHETVPTNHNLFQEKGEPKRYRAETILLTSLTPLH